MEKSGFDFIGFEDSYDISKVVLFGAPFDATSSFKPGSRFGPNAMREDSWALESYSPYLDKDLNDLALFDYGNLELPFGDKRKSIDIIYEFIKKILKDKKIPIMLGGEHLVTFASVKALYENHKDLHIIHFDAHTDLRDDYLGESFSHATVIKRVHDIVGDNRINQFCIRSGLKEEFEWAKIHTNLEKFTFNTLDNCIDKLKDKNVYITIDLDVLDPSILPGTGTPEPGGITFNDMMIIIKKLSNLNSVVGIDIVELSPKYDISGVSTSVACKILRELTLSVIK
jgi:agmatinase